MDHKIKRNKSEKKDKRLDLVRELKKTVEHEGDGDANCNWYTWIKGLVKRLEDLEIRGQVETIQTTALLRSSRILRRVLETWRDLLSLKLLWKTSAKAGGKICQKRMTTLINYIYQEKREEEDLSASILRIFLCSLRVVSMRWRIDTTTWRLHRKTRRRTDYSHQKQYWQDDRQQNDNN